MLLETECYKRLKSKEKMKNALNGAMRAVTDLVHSRAEKSQNEDDFREKKLHFLQTRLQKLSSIVPTIFDDHGPFSPEVKKGNANS